MSSHSKTFYSPLQWLLNIYQFHQNVIKNKTNTTDLPHEQAVFSDGYARYPKCFLSCWFLYSVNAESKPFNRCNIFIRHAVLVNLLLRFIVRVRSVLESDFKFEIMSRKLQRTASALAAMSNGVVSRSVSSIARESSWMDTWMWVIPQLR